MNNDDPRLTPKDLARELGVTAKAIRAFLRSKYGKLDKSVVTRWRLDDDQVVLVRERFRR